MFSKSAKQLYRQVGTLFLLVGILFVIIGSVGMAHQAVARHTLQTTEAEILSVHSGYTEVRYFAEGQLYTAELNYRSTSQRAGDKVKIYYELEYPEKASVKLPFFFEVFFLTGTVVLIAGICLKRQDTILERKKQYLLKYGKRISAKVIGVETDYHFRRNYSYAKTLVCQYGAPDGTIHIFKSEPIWVDLPNDLKSETVIVYINQEDFSNYYVDLSSVMPAIKVHRNW